VWGVTSAADPVAAFLEAHATGGSVALATSGTSGPQRSVVRTTDSWVSSFDAVAGLTGLTSASRVWVPGPLTATMNLFAAVHARTLGAALVTDPISATHAHLTPSGLASLLTRGAPLAGLTVVVAGDRLTPAVHDRAARAGARVLHYYGAAELSFVAWGAHAGDLRPFPGVTVAVREGEIWVRSPYLCSGYDGPPGPLRLDADGFATVGDRGVLEDGRLTVHGRPGTVTVGGSTVETAAVEGWLQSAATGTVAVVGMPHDDLGEVLAVVLSTAADHAALRRLARSELDGAHRPRLWWHVEALPTTPAGKVDRLALVSLLSSGGGRARRLV
jgi:acyl-CoA synthetase (AMP-forming)/AMP-acid ligase II